MSEDEYARGYREGWYDAKAQAADRIEVLEAALKEAGEMWVRKDNRIGVLELALRTAARRFNFMAGVGWINGVDPAVAHNECVAALQPEEDK